MMGWDKVWLVLYKTHASRIWLKPRDFLALTVSIEEAANAGKF